MSLVKEYFELTKKYQKEYGEKTLLLMQVGAFFECYGLQDKTTEEISGSQIVEFSELCDLNIADKKSCVGKEGVLMAGFSHYMIEKYLKKLQSVGYTVVVYTQDEQKSNTTRSLSAIYSPGTYFSHDSTHITNNTTCIWVNLVDNSSALLKKLSKKEGDKLVQVGIANIDIYTGKTAIFEFKETYIKNPTTFDELERFISIYKPSEAILIANMSDSEMDDILSYANIQCQTIHKIGLLSESNKTALASRCEKQIYQREILEKFYSIKDYSTFSQSFYDNDNTISIQAFCFLLDFIYQHNPNLVNKISEPCFENCSDRLLLANHSLKQLNIINDGVYTGKFSSVEKMLNLCITAMGKRRFSHLFLNPTTNREYLQSEYNITEHFLSGYDSWNNFLPLKLHGIKDIGKMNRQLIMKKINPKSLFHLYSNLHTIEHIFKKVEIDDKLNTYLQKTIPHCNRISLFCKELIGFLDKTIDISLCEEIDTFHHFETNFIKNGVDIGLDTQTKLLSESSDQLEAIRQYFNQTISKYEKKTTSKTTDYVKIHETEKNVFSLVATQRRVTILKQMIGSKDIELNYLSSLEKKERTFILNCSITSHNQSASNEAIVSNQIQELCKNISIAKVEMKDVLTQVYLNSVVQQLATYQSHFEAIIEFVTTMDVIYAKASIAKKYHYCKPEVVDNTKNNNIKGFIRAKGLRHCLIENIQKDEIYVVNDIEIGSGMDGILLYGTNAVGKTSFIRAIGIAIIMAQAGLYVPCSRFEYAPYNAIFTRILGNDNIFKGLSTFAVEMSELRTILRLADENSLVLGDELCSGTESISAKSIFVAGLEQLYKKHCSYIFATHLHEIVTYSEIQSMKTLVLKHMEVVYDREKDILVYDRKLKDGPGNNMYGLEVCKSLNLPANFLEAANTIRMKYHSESASLLSLHSSHFNSKKLMKMCEQCGTHMGQEMHHIRPQKDADAYGFIYNSDGAVFHKNHVANLLSLCETCHLAIHHASVEKNDIPTNVKRGKEKVSVKKTDFSQYNLYT